MLGRRSGRSRASVYAEPPAASTARAKASSRFPFIRKVLSVFNRKPTAIHPTNSRSPVAMPPVAIHPTNSRSPVAVIPQIDIEIANRWIENPLVNPYTKKVIEVSIHPSSAYVAVYKKVMKGLIAYFRSHYEEEYILTIEDCKYIKDNLPIIHSIIDIKDEYIKYDHLFIRYFVNKKVKGNYIYDIRYREDSDIKLYLNIYKSIKTKKPISLSPRASQKLKSLPLLPLPQPPKTSLKLIKPIALPLPSLKLQEQLSPVSPNSPKFAIENYKTLEDLLRNNIDFSKTDISIGKLVMNMCVDIRRILYMRKDDKTLENYKIALHNKKTLKYVNYIYNNLKFAEISGIYGEMSRYYDRLPANTIEDIKQIYNKIKTYFDDRLYGDKYKEIETKKITEADILTELIKIYEHILRLYARHFNYFIDPSKKIKYNEEGSINVIKLNPYCPIDAEDIITLDDISDYKGMRREYVFNTTIYNKTDNEVSYFCNDTVSLYNYILEFIAVSTEGKNDTEQAQEILNSDKDKLPKEPIKYPNTQVPFTDDELDELCNKIKFLTEKPTYNSHKDIYEALNQKYIKNTKRLLRLKYDLSQETIIALKKYKDKYDNSYPISTTLNRTINYYMDDYNDEWGIRGEYKAIIVVNFGEISLFDMHLHLIKNIVEDIELFKLPIFKYHQYNIRVNNFINKIREYIEGDNPIIEIKPFEFKRDDDAHGLYDRFITYEKETEERLLQVYTKHKGGGSGRGRGRGKRGRK